MPAAGVVLVELGFEGDALLAIYFLSDGHGVAEQWRDVDGLLAAWLRVVVPVDLLLGR